MGCDNAAELFTTWDRYDQEAELQELFSMPIDWNEEATRLSWVMFLPAQT